MSQAQSGGPTREPAFEEREWQNLSFIAVAASCPDSKDNLAITYPPEDKQMVERSPRGGDYIGLTASANSSFHPVWIDGRNGIFQVYTARIEARSGEKAVSK